MVVVHCSSSDNSQDDSVQRIKLLHTGNKKTPIKWGKYDTHCRGWSDIGYHYVITKDGEVHSGRPIERAGAHAKGFNKSSIGICLTGDKEFSDEQFKSLKTVIDELILNFGLSIIDIIEHNELNSSKTCPNFDLKSKIGYKDK